MGSSFVLEKTNTHSVMKILKFSLLLSVLIFLSTSLVHSQSSGIEGFITDKTSNETITGATVMLEGTGYKTFTDMDGHFIFKDVKPGEYKLLVMMISYKTLTIDHVKVETGNNLVFKEALNQQSNSLPGELEPILSKPDLKSEISLSSL